VGGPSRSRTSARQFVCVLLGERKSQRARCASERLERSGQTPRGILRSTLPEKTKGVRRSHPNAPRAAGGKLKEKKRLRNGTDHGKVEAKGRTAGLQHPEGTAPSTGRTRTSARGKTNRTRRRRREEIWE